MKRTPLYPIHLELGAKMTSFGGWEMPLQYSGILEEHRAVRERVGIFDIGHMGEIEIAGDGAEGFLQRLTPNNVLLLRDGGAQYSCLLNDRGGIIDDAVVYRLSPSRYLLCVNAANTDRDFQWIGEHAVPSKNVEVRNRTDHYALFSIQGPSAESLLDRFFGQPVGDIQYFRHRTFAGSEGEFLVSRTGYTGEDGFEIFFDSRSSLPVWKKLLDLGKEYGILPIGLGARDTLRLEMGYLLHRTDMDEGTTPLEAGLTWVVKFDKGEFVGREGLVRQRENGVSRKLIGFEMIDRGIPRHGYGLERAGRPVGSVTSGMSSPTLKKSIGLGYVEPALSESGTVLNVDIRGRKLACRVAAPPFYPPRIRR